MYGETLPCSIYFSSFTRHCAPGAVHDATTKPTASRRVVIFGKMLQVHLYRYMKPIPLIVHPPKTKTEAENHISQTSMFGFHVSFQVCKSSKNATSLSAGLHLFGERFSVSVNPLEHSSTFYSMPMHIKCTEFAQNTWKYHFPKHFQYRSELFSFLRLFFYSKETAPQPTSPILPWRPGKKTIPSAFHSNLGDTIQDAEQGILHHKNRITLAFRLPWRTGPLG